MEASISTAIIPADNLKRLTETINRLNGRARRRKLPELILQVSTPFIHVFERNTPATQAVTVQLTGALPAMPGGWKPAAILDHLSQEAEGAAQNMVHTIPGPSATMPVEYLTAEAKCDHCKYDRRRAKTIVLQNESGQFVQVGATCLGQFLHVKNADQILAMASIVAEASDAVGMGSYGWDRTGWPLIDVLTVAAMVIDQDGKFIPTSGGPGHHWSESTKHSVLSWLEQKPETRTSKPEFRHGIEASVTYDWMKQLSVAEVSDDYTYNLGVIAMSERVSARTMGLAVSAIPAFRRVQRGIERTQRQARDIAASNYIGEPGKRVVLPLMVSKVITFEVPGFGYRARPQTMYIFIMRDPSGNVVTWKTAAGELQEGQQLNLKCTIKEHEEYKGVKQTKVTRCKVQ